MIVGKRLQIQITGYFSLHQACNNPTKLLEERLSASLGVGNPSGIVCQRYMDIKQQTNKQKNNWWMDIDGFTYETWETPSRGYQCKWSIKQFEGNRSYQIFCVFARFSDYQYITIIHQTETNKQKRTTTTNYINDEI